MSDIDIKMGEYSSVHEEKLEGIERSVRKCLKEANGFSNNLIVNEKANLQRIAKENQTKLEKVLKNGIMVNQKNFKLMFKKMLGKSVQQVGGAEIYGSGAGVNGGNSGVGGGAGLGLDLGMTKGVASAINGEAAEEGTPEALILSAMIRIGNSLQIN
jgi:hypothetical protein